ncbi:MAG: squalene synthase HpnC [Ignavibacteriaceae bacterium]|nr:squalene synthase HpnC [Ignavibacteriaceae bacterium]
MANTKNLSSNLAYKKAEEFAKSHYENFPVISIFIKKELRKHIAIIYWFARTADDIADEGILTSSERLIELNKFEERLTQLLAGNFENEYEYALYLTIKNKKLDHEYFYKLIAAFKQDIEKSSWTTFDEILNYCSNSANPVGRLILQLYGIDDKEAFYYSDKICTALQLTNFYQDVSVDLKKNRVYFPVDEIKNFGVSFKLFDLNEKNDNLKQLLTFSIERTESFYSEGEKLLGYLSGRLKYEIKWTIMGGREILNKLRIYDNNIVNLRPTLSKFDYFYLFIKSLLT